MTSPNRPSGKRPVAQRIGFFERYLTIRGTGCRARHDDRPVRAVVLVRPARVGDGVTMEDR